MEKIKLRTLLDPPSYLGLDNSQGRRAVALVNPACSRAVET